MIIRGVGVGGWGGVLTSLTSTSFTLRKMQTLHMLSVVSKIIPTKGSSCQPQTKNLFTKTKTYHFRGRLWDNSYRTFFAGTQQMDGTWKHLKKWRPPSMLHKKKTKTCTKKGTLGPTAGPGVTTLPCCRLWLLRCHKRSGTASVEKRKKLEEWVSPWYDSDDWKSYISNVFVLTLEEQNRVTAQAKRKFSLLSHTPANRNECPCC